MVEVVASEGQAGAVEKCIADIRAEERGLREQLVRAAASLAMDGEADGARACLEVARHIRDHGIG